MYRSMRQPIQPLHAWVIVLFLVIAALPGIAQAGVQDLKGDVTDPRGVVISGARVSDGAGKSTFTGSNGQPPGRYLIEEMALGTYQVSVTKAGFNAASQSVDPVKALGDVDFTLSYAISGSVTPNAFRNDPPQQITVYATSIVPSTGTCVTFVDEATGGTAALTYNGGNNRWEGSYQVGEHALDGTYRWTLRATDCESGIALSNEYTSAYVVDKHAGYFVPSSVLPQDGGNTIFASQPLLARIRDYGGSGIDLASIRFSLENATTGETTQLPAISYDAVTGWTKTSPVALSPGTRYRMSVSADDFAGNRSSYSQAPFADGGGFLSSSLTVTDAPASIDPANPKRCEVEPLAVGATKRRVNCVNVPVTIGSSSAFSAGTLHPGEVAFTRSVPLSGAKVRTDAGAEYPALPGQSLGLAPRTILGEFQLTSTGSGSVALPATVADLGTLSFDVPAAIDSASIFMPEVSTASTAPIACVDPAIDSANDCGPDPVIELRRVTHGSATFIADGDELNVSDLSGYVDVFDTNGNHLGREGPGQTAVAQEAISLNDSCRNLSVNAAGDPPPYSYTPITLTFDGVSFTRYMYHLARKDRAATVGGRVKMQYIFCSEGGSRVKDEAHKLRNTGTWMSHPDGTKDSLLDNDCADTEWQTEPSDSSSVSAEVDLGPASFKFQKESTVAKGGGYECAEGPMPVADQDPAPDAAARNAVWSEWQAGCGWLSTQWNTCGSRRTQGVIVLGRWEFDQVPSPPAEGDRGQFQVDFWYDDSGRG